jgi:hypothetical protein
VAGDIYGKLFGKQNASTLKEVSFTKTTSDVPLFSFLAVRRYRNFRFSKRRIGRDDMLTWPSRSPDLNPLYYRMWGRRNTTVFALKAKKEILLNQILGAAKRINIVTFLTEVKISLVTQVTMCIQIDGDQFEQRASVLNCVILTIFMNKYQ